MSVTYRQVFKTDLPQIAKLEAAAFGMKEEQAEQEMKPRLAAYPETFIVAEDHERIVGYIFGPATNTRYLEDKLYYDNKPNSADAAYQTVLSLVVAPQFQHNGIATNLLQAMSVRAHHDHRQAITLTCTAELMEFYQERGFRNEGKAQNLPGENKYNMVHELN
jgi:predicted N-acetyltransferase YhbS